MALYRKVVNTGAFIASHLDEHAKSTKVVIGWGGIIIVLAGALGYGARVDTLSILYRSAHIHMLTCINMKLFKAIHNGQLWLNHHGRALFSFPNQAKTTITHLSNLIYHDDIDGESGGESDDNGAHDGSGDDDDVEEAPREHTG